MHLFFFQSALKIYIRRKVDVHLVCHNALLMYIYLLDQTEHFSLINVSNIDPTIFDQRTKWSLRYLGKGNNSTDR